MSRVNISTSIVHCVVIWPWNLETEKEQQHAYMRERAGQFVVAVPTLTISS